jgi:glycosyltransferase involved in cell wall biosynthesis
VRAAAEPGSHKAPRVRFVGSLYAGHATRFANLIASAAADERIRPSFFRVTGWEPGRFIERLSPVPLGLRQRARAVAQAAPLARLPRPDAIWTSCREEMTPFTWAQMGPLHRPLILDLDATDAQLEAMAMEYYDRPPKRGLRLAQARIQEAMARRQVTLFTPWSNWAAEGLVTEGVDPAAVRVLPPGVDLHAWKPVVKPAGERPLRVLFVGGDFGRKGGDILVDAIASRGGDFEAVFVTHWDRDSLPPHMRIERASPNSPELRALFDWADLFVVPSRAECFGIATVEAMAAGLPVIVTDLGGARDIVEPGVTGWLVAPGIPALTAALDAALEHRAHLAAIGARGRARAERYFDGAKNDRQIVDWLLELVDNAAHRARKPSRSTPPVSGESE